MTLSLPLAVSVPARTWKTGVTEAPGPRHPRPTERRGTPGPPTAGMAGRDRRAAPRPRHRGCTRGGCGAPGASARVPAVRRPAARPPSSPRPSRRRRGSAAATSMRSSGWSPGSAGCEGPAAAAAAGAPAGGGGRRRPGRLCLRPIPWSCGEERSGLFETRPS